MLNVDLIGILITVCLTGIRYPHYALGAAAVHDGGLVVVALFLQGRVEAVQAAGAFGAATVSGIAPGIPSLAAALGGALANFAVGLGLGGVAHENAGTLLRSGAPLAQPFAVINLRFAVASAAVTVWKLIVN